jgi:hypothetical protein
MFANFLAMIAVIAHAAKAEMTLSMARPLRLNANRRQCLSSLSNPHHPKSPKQHVLMVLANGAQ